MSPKRVSARMEPSNPVDIGSPEFRTDEFRMYGLKVIDCSRRYCHDWTTCPFAHPNEKARRRDPRRFSYTGIACPFIKQNNHCPYGLHCPYAHNVFEYWLHPTRYRTQLCNVAASCNRTVCFFAHTIEELRIPVGTEVVGGDAFSVPQNLNPFLRNSSDLRMMAGVGVPASTMALEPQAKYILEQLIAFRQLELRLSDSSTSDLQEIQTLITLLQQQQVLAGVPDHNPELQLHFLDTLFRSLAQVVAGTVLQSEERERLMKLIRWMYVQLVQNRTSLFSTTDSMAPFAHRTETMHHPFVQHLGEAISSRQSLSSIPEMAEVPPQLMPLQGPGITSHIPPSPIAELLTANRRPSSLDSGPLRHLAPGTDLRMSDESSASRMTVTCSSGSHTFQRSSAESESCPRPYNCNVLSQDSSRLSWEEAGTTPEFIFQEWLTTQVPPSSAPPSRQSLS